MFEKFFRREVEEIKNHKARLAGVVLCLVFAIIFAVWSNLDSGEEIILTDAPSEKVFDKKISAPLKVDDRNVIEVIGADSSILFVGDPFRAEEVVEEIELPKVEEKTLPPTETPPQEKNPPPEEKFYLLGTAIGAEEKIAFVRHEKNSAAENLFLKTGDSLKGKRIVEIAEDFLTLEGGERLYIDY